MRTYLLAVAVALLMFAGALFVRRLSTLVHGTSTTGRVLGHDTRTSDEEVAYHPVIEFADSTGNLHRFTSVAGRSSRNPHVGTTVQVRYLRADPQVAYIQSFLHMWAAPLACAALGLAALIALWRE